MPLKKKSNGIKSYDCEVVLCFQTMTGGLIFVFQSKIVTLSSIREVYLYQ